MLKWEVQSCSWLYLWFRPFSFFCWYSKLVLYIVISSTVVFLSTNEHCVIRCCADEKHAVDSLFIVNWTGTLTEYTLEPRVKSGLEKITDESPVEVLARAWAQWPLARSVSVCCYLHVCLIISVLCITLHTNLCWCVESVRSTDKISTVSSHMLVWKVLFKVCV